MNNTIVGLLAVALFVPAALFAYVDCSDNVNGCGTTESKITALQAQILQLTQIIAQLIAQKGSVVIGKHSVTWGGFTMDYPANWTLAIPQQETESTFAATLKDPNGRTVVYFRKFFAGGDSPYKAISSTTFTTHSGVILQKTVFQCEGVICQDVGMGEVQYRLENDAGASILIAVPVTMASYYTSVDAASNALDSWVKTLTRSQDTVSKSQGSCFVPTYDLYLGIADATTNGEVTQLQMWLKNTGYFPDANVTGYYGEKTAAAVVKWQKAHGMDFVTTKSGIGKQTRAKMQEACRGTVNEQCPRYNTPPVINSIAPSSGPIGTRILLQGCNFLGFESDKNLWVENARGEKGILYGDRDTSNTALKATIPASLCQTDTSYSGLSCPATLTIAPGTYTIRSSSYGGLSNSVTFTVTP